MRTSCCLTVLGIFLGAASARAAEPTIAALAITEAIQQLSSPRFVQRQAAIRALDTIGVPALDELRKAAASPDLETRREAAELIRRIERRAESALLTAPRRVKFSFDKVPLDDALERFSGKTGFPLRVEGLRKDELETRTVTLETGDVTLWEALDEFCRAAGLAERDLLEQTGFPTTIKEDAVTFRTTAEELAEKQSQRGSVGGRRPSPWLADRRIVLVPGQAPPRPVYHAGALRIRPVIRTWPGWGRTPGTDEAICTIEVAHSPGMAWHGVSDVRLIQAIDEREQKLSHVPNEPLPLGRVSRYDGMGWVIGGQLVVVSSASDEAANSAGTWSSADLRLRLGPKPVTMLKHLRGNVVGQMQTAPEPLLTISSVLKARGESVRRDDGMALTLREIGMDKDDVIRVEVEVDVPLTMARQTTAGSPLDDVRLQDADGQDLERLTCEPGARKVNGRALSYAATFHFQPNKGQGPASRLVLIGRRTVVVEIPFHLENVVLP